jgi:hypothetical protein
MPLDTKLALPAVDPADDEVVGRDAPARLLRGLRRPAELAERACSTG